MSDYPLFILLILFLNISLCEWLVQRSFFKHFGTALLVIILTAIVANLNIIPSASDAPPLYDHIFSYIAPLAIFFLLLEANLAAIRKAGLPILLLFLLGSAGVLIGTVLATWAIDGSQSIGPLYPALAGMFTGTYTGGSINFNAVALYYEVQKEGNLYAGAVAIDNIVTAIWMMATIALPKILSGFFPRKKSINANDSSTLTEKDTHDREKVSPFHLSILIALGITTLLLSDWLASLSAQAGWNIPSILILTTISLALAQVSWVRHLHGSRVLGMIGIYLFLAIIGAYCEFASLSKIGSLAYYILIFASILVAVHGIIIYGIGSLFKQDWDLISLASQSNVGGSGSAIALAKSLNRHDLLLPAILLGTLGNALGTYLGFLVAGLL